MGASCIAFGSDAYHRCMAGSSFVGAKMNILITGGAGFIGSAVVRHLIENTQHAVVNVDALTYAGSGL